MTALLDSVARDLVGPAVEPRGDMVGGQFRVGDVSEGGVDAAPGCRVVVATWFPPATGPRVELVTTRGVVPVPLEESAGRAFGPPGGDAGTGCLSASPGSRIRLSFATEGVGAARAFAR